MSKPGFFTAFGLFLSNYLADKDKTIEALKTVQTNDVALALENLTTTIRAALADKNIEVPTVDLRSPNKEVEVHLGRLGELKEAFKKIREQANDREMGLFVEFMENNKKQSKTLRGVKDIEQFIAGADSGQYRII